MLNELLEQDARVLRDPAFQVMVSNLADSAVTLNLRCWANSGDYWSLRFHLIRRCKEVLDAAGITIPFPQRDVHLFPAPPGPPA